MLDMYVDIKNHLVHGLVKKLRISVLDANNYQTVGYKSHNTDFTTLMARQLSPGGKSQNPSSISSSSVLSHVRIDFSQGPITLGSSMDMAVSGEGFFVLSENAAASGTAAGAVSYVYTRKGRFMQNSLGEIIDSEGRCLYGYRVNESGEVVDHTLVKLQTDGHDVGFENGGYLVERFDESKNNSSVQTKKLFKVALSTFSNKDGLIETAGTAFAKTESSGEPLGYGSANTKIVAGNAAKYGQIMGGSLEGSNVDVAKLSLDMNQVNREFSAIQGTMDNVTKIFSGLISKILG